MMGEGSTRRALSGWALASVLAMALFFRLYGLSWDDGLFFHPDERQILMVTERLVFPWPPDWRVLLSTESPWNPKFFAYGSLPLYLLRLTTNLVSGADAGYETLYRVGRALSALFDVGTVALVYLLGRRLYGGVVALLASAFVALAVLHIQLSHFYAVDTLLALLVVATVGVALQVVERPRLSLVLPLGALWGAALATKVSAAPLGLTVACAWVWPALRSRPEGAVGPEAPYQWRFWRVTAACLLTGVVAALVFLICEPYAVIDSLGFGRAMVGESYMAYGVQ